MKHFFLTLILLLCAPLPVKAQSGNGCLLIMASRNNLQETRQLVKQYENRIKTSIFRAPNGVHTLTYGIGRHQDGAQLLKYLKASKRIPQDSFCSSGKNYTFVASFDKKSASQTVKKPATTPASAPTEPKSSVTLYAALTGSDYEGWNRLLYILIVIGSGIASLVGAVVLYLQLRGFIVEIILILAVIGIGSYVYDRFTGPATAPKAAPKPASTAAPKPVEIESESARNYALKFCNKSSKNIETAVAYVLNERDKYYTLLGWWTIEPGTCKTPVTGSFGRHSSRKIFYFAEDMDGKAWSGNGQLTFCISKARYTRKLDNNGYKCKPDEKNHPFGEFTITPDKPKRTLNFSNG